MPESNEVTKAQLQSLKVAELREVYDRMELELLYEGSSSHKKADLIEFILESQSFGRTVLLEAEDDAFEGPTIDDPYVTVIDEEESEGVPIPAQIEMPTFADDDDEPEADELPMPEKAGFNNRNQRVVVDEDGNKKLEVKMKVRRSKKKAGPRKRKLTDEQVRDIRKMRANTELSYAKIGAEFGISGMMVKNIVDRNVYSDVE